MARQLSLQFSGALFVAICAGCRGAPEAAADNRAARPSAATERPAAAANVPSAPVQHHGSRAAPTELRTARLRPLQAAWLEWVKLADSDVALAPPVGATSPRRLVIGVHGAGDRADWSCGGWRLACQAAELVACPQGSKTGPQTFAWASASSLETRVEDALSAARERYGEYIDQGPMIYAGFSQGATLAEPFLRKNAARFPIAILAEGGYRTVQNASFANAYKMAGGHRIVLVCGTSGCFSNAAGAQRILERAGLEVLVVGDAKAGHNLNDRMQKALQSAWPRIAAPLSQGVPAP